MKAPPAVSAIIPVYNRETYVADAISSLLEQSFSDFELIVIDDGSTDRTSEVLSSFRDDRIRIVRNHRNMGIPATRNMGLELARGQYIAWLDSDDLARPRRFAKQVAYLANHREVALIGSCVGKRGPDGESLRGLRVPPMTFGHIRAWLLFRCCIPQYSVMGRAEVLKRHLYRERFPVCADFDLYIRIAQDHPMVNLPTVLVNRRLHETRITQTKRDLVREKNLEILREQLDRLKLSTAEDDLERHYLLARLKQRSVVPDRDYLEWAEHWLRDLQAANASSASCPPRALAHVAGQFWAYACWHAIPALGFDAYWTFLRSSLSRAALAGVGRMQLWNYFRAALSTLENGRLDRNVADGA